MPRPRRHPRRDTRGEGSQDVVAALEPDVLGGERLAEVGVIQDGSGQMDAVHLGTFEGCAGEVRAGQGRLRQDDAVEGGARKVGTRQVCALEVGGVERRAGKVRARQSGT